MEYGSTDGTSCRNHLGFYGRSLRFDRQSGGWAVCEALLFASLAVLHVEGFELSINDIFFCCSLETEQSNQSNILHITLTWKLRDVSGGNFVVVKFLYNRFFALWFVSRRFSSSPALFTIVFINELNLFTPLHLP